MKKNNIALLTSQEWIGRTQNNKLLIDALRKKGVFATEVCWNGNRNNSWDHFDCVLICNTWGYENDYESYLKVLYEIEHKTVLYNSYAIVKRNIFKENQFLAFKQHGIPCINTIFLSYSESDDAEAFFLLGMSNPVVSIQTLLSSRSFVLKPNISASGGNTFLFDNIGTRCNSFASEQDVEIYCLSIFQKNLHVMAQPFVSGIDNGEYALIYFNKKLSHAVLRYPGRFCPYKKAQPIKQIPGKVLELAEIVVEKIIGDDCVYARIDIVLDDGIAKVMELECNEPELYLYCLDEKIREQAICHLSDIIINGV